LTTPTKPNMVQTTSPKEKIVMYQESKNLLLKRLIFKVIGEAFGRHPYVYHSAKEKISKIIDEIVPDCREVE